MNNPAKAVLLSLLAVLVAACSGPQVIGETNPTVTYSHGQGDTVDADRRARDYCLREYGGDFRVITREARRTTYECVRS
jgi:hypothetical protein